MDNIKIDFEYYRAVIGDAETDSSPLADFELSGFDEAYFEKHISEKLLPQISAYCYENKAEVMTFFKTALMVLLSKYTNSNMALCAFTQDEKPFPVFSDSEKQTDFAAYYSCVKEQLDKFSVHSALSFTELCSEFEMSSLPFITSEKSFFDTFSLSDYKDIDAKLCFFISAEKNRINICVKYNKALYTTATIERIISSFNKLLEEIVSGKDSIAAMSIVSDELEAELDSFNNSVIDFDDSLSVVDLIRNSTEKYPDNIAVVYKDTKYT